MSGIIPEFLTALFQREAKVLGWVWVPDTQVVTSTNQPVQQQPDFGIGQDYVMLRLAEMYLKRTRVLWKEFYPVVHSFVAYGDPAGQRSIATVAGPGQLKDLGTDDMDRLINLACKLAGPMVYDGQDIELLAGLYAVPAKDGAKLLIDTLAQLSGLVPALKQLTEVAGIVKGGMEGLLGLSGTALTLGIHDVLRAPGAGVGRSARPGFIVAINGPADQIKPDMLWIKDGRLFEGPNPIAAKPFDSYDMMLFEIHRGPSRASTWATQPKLAPHVQLFDLALREKPPVVEKINNLFLDFDADVGLIDDLTLPDKAAIRALVGDDIKARVAKIRGGGLIEMRSVGGTQEQIAVEGFSPLAIPDLPPGVPLPVRPPGQPLFKAGDA
jgi:hypothetical protein